MDFGEVYEEKWTCVNLSAEMKIQGLLCKKLFLSFLVKKKKTSTNCSVWSSCYVKTNSIKSYLSGGIHGWQHSKEIY